MRRHIVCSLIVMLIISVVGNGAEEKTLHVVAYGGIAVLIKCQRGGGMLQQQMQSADVNARHISQLIQNFIRYQMKPTRFGAKRERLLIPHVLLLDKTLLISLQQDSERIKV